MRRCEYCSGIFTCIWGKPNTEVSNYFAGLAADHGFPGGEGVLIRHLCADVSIPKNDNSIGSGGDRMIPRQLLRSALGSLKMWL